MQVYYGKVIRNNVGNVQGAHDAVLAILEHCASTDEHPRHHLCSKGEDPVCSWQRALVKKTIHKHKKPLPEAIHRAAEPLFIRWAEPSLLEKCNQGVAQNILVLAYFDQLPKLAFSPVVMPYINLYIGAGVKPP